MSFLDYKVGVKTPKLEVPSEFKPTLPSREWVITPFNGNPFWSAIIAILPALLGTILIFMDQQITAVIVNRKENKLKKGCGYHLDLFVLAILIQICSVMGLPWFVAATVLSINHVNSLKVESECAAPGEKPRFLGVREQRVTHILIFLTIGCSVVLTPILSHIPMPVLFGVFLYMGVASLKGLQFFDRILIMFMPQKYQPDHMFLRQVIFDSSVVPSPFVERLSNLHRFQSYYCFQFSGANTSSPFIHCHPIDLPRLPLGNKVLLVNLNFVPAHVGSNDRHQEISGLLFHSTRDEDIGRCDARDDQAEP